MKNKKMKTQCFGKMVKCPTEKHPNYCDGCFQKSCPDCHQEEPTYAGDSGLGGNDPQEPVWDWQAYPEEVVKFIRQLLIRTEGDAYTEGYQIGYKDGEKSQRTELLKVLERMKNYHEMAEMESKQYADGFHQALADVLDNLK